VILTHIGGPTVLVEVDGWRLLTDPTFDAAGGHYDFGWGTSSNKFAGPAVSPTDLPPIDVVLLTHDHHWDNLDAAGRALLPAARTVVTTVSGARRLGLAHARGLRTGSFTKLTAAGRPELTVLATPARHGPALSRPIVGDVIGFALRRTGRDGVFLWVTGDTVLHRPLRQAATAMKVDVALVHVGGVQFPITGPVRYTMTGRRAVQLIGLTGPRVALPIHYEGWSHFKHGREAIERALATASADIQGRVHWLETGTPQHIDQARFPGTASP
jgi:L-ascorbate metabolism protein UlaG (beta-lactamase superfamily)